MNYLDKMLERRSTTEECITCDECGEPMRRVSSVAYECPNDCKPSGHRPTTAADEKDK
jgi:hypothetical protein